MSYSVRRLELEGLSVIASASVGETYPDLWRAQNEAERLARRHDSFLFDQERECWQGSDTDGKIFRYFAITI